MSNRLLRKSSCAIKPSLALVQRELDPLDLMSSSIICIALHAIGVHTCGILEGKLFTLCRLDDNTVQVLFIADCARMFEHCLSKRTVLFSYEAGQYSIVPDMVMLHKIVSTIIM